MVRGGFIDGRSDIDMMAIVSNRSEKRRLREFYLSFCKSQGCGDEPEFEKAKDTIPFQFFIYTLKELGEMNYGIYYEDFLRNHTVLLGEDITSLIKRPDYEMAARTLILNALRSSRSWKNPSRKTMKRHLIWTKFYPAYLAIETAKAALLYHGVLDFNKTRLIKRIEKIPNFKEKTLVERALQMYLNDEARGMSLDELKLVYRQIHQLIRYVAQLCEISY